MRYETDLSDPGIRDIQDSVNCLYECRSRRGPGCNRWKSKRCGITIGRALYTVTNNDDQETNKHRRRCQ